MARGEGRGGFEKGVGLVGCIWVRGLIETMNAEDCQTFRGWTFNLVLSHRHNLHLSTCLNPSALKTPSPVFFSPGADPCWQTLRRATPALVVVK